MKKFAVILLLLSFIATLTLAGYKTFLALTHPTKYQNEITTYSQEYSLDPVIVASLINVESSYKKNAKSQKNAIGLMQIKLNTANYLNNLKNFENITEEQLFTPNINIKYGCMYLNYLNKKFDDIYTCLAAYNAGETITRSWLSSSKYSTDGKTLHYIPYEETANYIEKIKKNIKFYKKIYKNT